MPSSMLNTVTAARAVSDTTSITTTNTTITNSTTTTTTPTVQSASERRGAGNRMAACLASLPPWRVVVTVLACVAMEATLGVSYTTANLMPYMTSYIRNITGETSVDYGEMLWVHTSNWLVVSTSVPLMGLVERRIPNRIYAFVGVCLNAAAFFGTYWAIRTSFLMLVIVHSIIQGFAQSILYPNFLNLALKWFPHRRGLMSGIAMGGYGGGAFIWNQVVTWWVNPENLQPDLIEGENRYFTQADLLSRVPSCFLVLGGILISIQLVCVFVVIYPKALTLAQGSVLMETTVMEEDNKEKEQMLDADVRHSLPDPFSVGSALADPEPEKTASQSILVESAPEKLTSESGPVGCAPEKGEQDSRWIPSTPDPDFAESGPETYRSESGGVHLMAANCVMESPTKSINAKHAEGEGEEGRTLLNGDDRTQSWSTPDDVIANGQDQRVAGSVTGSPPVRSTQHSLLGILKLRVTWTIWLNNLCMDYAFLFIVVFHKAFAQTFIANDHLLALVASVASVFNAVGRPIWGLVADRLGYLPAMLMTQGLLLVTSATFLTSQLAGSSAMYFVWVCGMFAAFSGIYSLQSPIIFTLYGPRDFIFALGLITTTGVISTLTSVPVAEVILAAFGWHGIYLLTPSIVLMGILILASMLLSCRHPIAPHIRSGLMVPIRRSALRRSRHHGTTLA